MRAALDARRLVWDDLRRARAKFENVGFLGADQVDEGIEVEGFREE